MQVHRFRAAATAGLCRTRHAGREWRTYIGSSRSDRQCSAALGNSLQADWQRHDSPCRTLCNLSSSNRSHNREAEKDLSSFIHDSP
jgi:hypothetical protein